MTFWKPGKKKPGTDIELDRETQQEGGFQYISNKYAGLTISQQRQRLPIYKHRKVYMRIRIIYNNRNKYFICNRKISCCSYCW